ncbi:Rossman fold protein, TIGR00730 family [Fructilactobacillus lindneri]|nr:TIGR00730 family Rossman fold protein [Fructilactobacillus lindneri]ANZ57495.1 Rossman fold protein, TIGR00730 family [Fructilactobacillus lindneri]ANZ58763.1 Rossman fold protein, TIGR00730 family [Fructilactobacillus lindneri]POG97807.1 Rossman fold protein, TIGR00730 family [Fructilactobacillus lindneri]POG99140.1 Rossman fold protein, TIGR00730 family [Fructilactobacillus lindneri]POH01303.1 Rossman fold protein, TIGR00730 family [Fructilactobacillus lindneri]
MKAVAVYCGASAGNDVIYQQATKQLAKWLVDHQLELVYGGGGVGLMGLLASTVLELGGKVHGIMPRELVERGASKANLTSLEVVENMSIRKRKMIEASDGCIVLPGGPGTLEEISEAYSWTRIGDNNNPCVLFNVAGYYDSLEKFFDEMTKKEFLTDTDREKLLFSDSLDEIYNFMENYQPPKIRAYQK